MNLDYLAELFRLRAQYPDKPDIEYAITNEIHYLGNMQKYVTDNEFELAMSNPDKAIQEYAIRTNSSLECAETHIYYSLRIGRPANKEDE